MTISMQTEDKSDDKTRHIEHTIALTNVDHNIARAVEVQLEAVRDWAQVLERQGWEADSLRESIRLLTERVADMEDDIEEQKRQVVTSDIAVAEAEQEDPKGEI